MRKLAVLFILAALTLIPVSPVAKPQTDTLSGALYPLKLGLKDEAKTKLEALEKRLPEIVAQLEMNDAAKLVYRNEVFRPKLRLVRRLGATQAKVSWVLEYTVIVDNKEERLRYGDVLVSIFLSYFDGAWTTTNLETTFSGEEKDHFDKRLRWLMLAIDEDGGK